MRESVKNIRLRVRTVFGIRPEAIKMASVVKARAPDRLRIQVMRCVTAQHRQMLDQVPDRFAIGPGLIHHAVDTIRQGKNDISEFELHMLAQAGVTACRPRATAPRAPAEAVPVAVPTRFMDGRKADLSLTQAPARSIAPAGEFDVLKPECLLGGIRVIIADILAAGSERTMITIGVARPRFAFGFDCEDRGESLAVRIAKGVAPLSARCAVEPTIGAYSGKWGGCRLSPASTDEALASANLVCVPVKHRLFIEAGSEIRKHTRAIDAVSLFASGVTRN